MADGEPTPECNGPGPYVPTIGLSSVTHTMNSKTKSPPNGLLQDWSAKGSHLEIPGTAATRIWRAGSGPTVVCLHGMPTSAYLYRKVLPELASRGLEGVAMDFPGLGFAERPAAFDYT